MAIRGKTPRGSPNQNHWRTDKLDPGQAFDGWLAGDGLCVQCHEAPMTKPCIKRYTGFDSPCPGCASRLGLVDIIFVPVYRDIVLSRNVVPLRYAAAKFIEKFPLHHCVVVTRPKGRNEGRRIETRAKAMAFPGGPEHQMPACIAEWLPVLWRYTDRITGTHLLNGPVFDTDPVKTMEAALSAPTVQEVGDEIQFSAEVIAETLGRLPKGTAKENHRQRSEAFVELMKKNKIASNGKH